MWVPRIITRDHSSLPVPSQYVTNYNTSLSLNKGAVEFEEEKISLASVTGPPSDISDRSANSFGAITNDQQRKVEGDGISLKSGSGSLQSGGGGPLVSISGSISATGVLISTSTSPSSAVTSNVTGVADSTSNLGGATLTTSGSSDMKGNVCIDY